MFLRAEEGFAQILKILNILEDLAEYLQAQTLIKHVQEERRMALEAQKLFSQTISWPQDSCNLESTYTAQLAELGRLEGEIRELAEFSTQHKEIMDSLLKFSTTFSDPAFAPLTKFASQAPAELEKASKFFESKSTLVKGLIVGICNTIICECEQARGEASSFEGAPSLEAAKVQAQIKPGESCQKTRTQSTKASKSSSVKPKSRSNGSGTQVDKALGEHKPSSAQNSTENPRSLKSSSQGSSKTPKGTNPKGEMKMNI